MEPLLHSRSREYSNMAFYFTCPFCFKKTLIDETLAGQSGPCVRCGKVIDIPSPPHKPAANAAPVDSPYVNVRQPIVQKRTRTWVLRIMVLCVGIAVVLGMGGAVIWPAFTGLKARRNKVACMSNLQRIALALNEYAAKHGTYPTPVVRDASGKPLYSWRVLILAELGEQSIAAKFNYDEPWDSNNNIRFLGQRCPRVYISPAVRGRDIAETNYFLVTGKGTLFPPKGPLTPKRVSDGLDKTLLVVESENTVTEWTKPVDIDITKLNPKIGASGPNTIGGTHEGGATAVFADGSPAWLPEDLPPTILHALISPQGSEPIDKADFTLNAN